MNELLTIGEATFVKHCATCHERDGMGQGDKYPALSGSEIATGAIEDHLGRVMEGKADTEMQAWAPQLSDLEIAAVITYERNSWNNDTGDVIQPITVHDQSQGDRNPLPVAQFPVVFHRRLNGDVDAP